MTAWLPTGGQAGRRAERSSPTWPGSCRSPPRTAAPTLPAASGVRFSDGAALRPEDVRASIERMLQVHARAPGFSGYLPIRGASRCRATHCDLSGGVEVDDAAGTVSIHLSRRDVEFLHKLVNALVVPAGSPRTFAKTRTLAGTGPYRVERWDPRRGGSLVRNPRFRVWSPDRPDGFPDRRRAPRPSAGAARGGRPRRVDLAWVDLHVLGATQVRTRYGPRLHTDPSAETGYVFLNTQAAPFDDARVRRALNYAVDRRRVAGLLGSSETQKPTCQLFPPGFQGYTPSCPFTLDPNAAGTWTGPDLARARRLIAASRTRGMKVEFWGSSGARRSAATSARCCAASVTRPAADVPRSASDRRARHTHAPAAGDLGLDRRLRRAVQLHGAARLLRGRHEPLALL